MITNYTQLKTEVADWAHRTDLTSRMDTFCQLAEALINKDLRTNQMVMAIDIIFSSHVELLPDNYLEMRWVIFDTTTYLESLTRKELDDRYSKASGDPVAYAFSGGALLIRPGGSVANPVTVNIEYYARVDTLVTNSVNVVLTAWPMVYFTAMMVQVSAYLQDNEEMEKWSSAYDAQIQQANKASMPGRMFQPRVRVF